MNKNKNIVVFDIETRTPINHKEDKGQLRVSVVVAYFYKDDSYKFYNENNILELIEELQKADLVVGFNLKGFDYPVLEKYASKPLDNLPTLDILEEIYYSYGRRIKLDNIAQATLGSQKTANGLMAVKYWKQGRINELIEYCRHDVELTKQLYDYGVKTGYLLNDNFGKLERIPVAWGKAGRLKAKLNKAFIDKKSINIYYSSSTADNGSGSLQKRLIDIYHINIDKIVAFCHLRQDLRTFNINRILDARVTNNTYEIPESFNVEEYLKKSK
jgi:DEAD/DEAH box helicase domain-containing protein